MKIQEVTKQTGLSIHALRYYEQIGLVAPIARAGNGHRAYTEDDVYRIAFVTTLRAAGMPIAEIKRYVELSLGGDDTVAERLEILEAHQQAVERQIAELRDHLDRISRKVAHYRELYRRPLAGHMQATEIV
jgi:DNA-binding transcriptional MerR regulator